MIAWNVPQADSINWPARISFVLYTTIIFMYVTILKLSHRSNQIVKNIDSLNINLLPNIFENRLTNLQKEGTIVFWRVLDPYYSRKSFNFASENNKYDYDTDLPRL